MFAKHESCCMIHLDVIHLLKSQLFIPQMHLLLWTKNFSAIFFCLFADGKWSETWKGRPNIIWIDLFVSPYSTTLDSKLNSGGPNRRKQNCGIRRFDFILSFPSSKCRMTPNRQTFLEANKSKNRNQTANKIVVLMENICANRFLREFNKYFNFFVAMPKHEGNRCRAFTASSYTYCVYTAVQ